MQPANLHNIFSRRKARHELQKKIQFSLSKVSGSAYERVTIYKNVNTELDWESKKEN